MVFGCEPKLKVNKPNNLIPKDKMTEILYDLFVLNSAKGTNRRTMELKGVQPESYLLQKHNIDSTQFAQSNNYYAHDIEGYIQIIETVKAKLKTQKDYFEAIDKKEQEDKKRKRDSIKQIEIKALKNKNAVVKNRASNLPESN